MAFTDDFSDLRGYSSNGEGYETDAPDFKELATKVSFVILRVLGSAVLGLASAAVVGVLFLVIATPFVDNDALVTIFEVAAMIFWPVMALVLWFTLFRSDQDL